MEDSAAFYELGLELLRNIEREEGNSLVSPISLMRPLAVLAMGARGNTRAQIEHVLGAPVDDRLEDELRDLAGQWSAAGDTFSLADSLWIHEEFRPYGQFLARARKSFGTDVRTRAFDEATLLEINRWVREKTHGMIDSILEDIDPACGLYVIDACAFEGHWEEPYARSAVKRAMFHSEDGSIANVAMMYEAKTSGYLENELCTGFMKDYEGGRYAFIGLLPRKGMGISRFLANLSGDHLAELASMHSRDTVTTGLPKFDGRYRMNLSPLLQRLGMTDAFNPHRADLSAIAADRMGEPLYVGEVAQRTFIEVNERGTRASAATSINTVTGARPIERVEHHTVILDRPFVYLIIDALENVPLFMGTIGTVQPAGGFTARAPFASDVFHRLRGQRFRR